VSILAAAVLGLIQGLTEFLPVSSSGHLAVLEHLWKLPAESRLPLTTMLHGATALAVVFYFAPVLVRLVRGLWAPVREQRRASWRLIGFLWLALVPAGVAGLALRSLIDRAFSSPLLVGLMLFVTGGALFGTRFARPRGRTGWIRAALVGVAQAIALLPGISRSGATIAGGLYLGMERKEAFEFSFLLSLPAVAGAFLLELREVDFAVLNPAGVAVGMALAFASGLAALSLLARAVTSHRLHWFAPYCWAAGLATVLLVR